MRPPTHLKRVLGYWERFWAHVESRASNGKTLALLVQAISWVDFLGAGPPAAS
jgi:hypothetical protein